MSPQILHRKLIKLEEHLELLKEFQGCSYDFFWEHHWKFERLFEVTMMIASDIIFHLLKIRDDVEPTTYRSAFLRAGEINLLSPEIASNLSLAAGMRNILVHQYEEIDYELLHRSIGQMISDFEQFFVEMNEVKI